MIHSLPFRISPAFLWLISYICEEFFTLKLLGSLFFLKKYWCKCGTLMHMAEYLIQPLLVYISILLIKVTELCNHHPRSSWGHFHHPSNIRHIQFPFISIPALGLCQLCIHLCVCRSAFPERSQKRKHAVLVSGVWLLSLGISAGHRRDQTKIRAISQGTNVAD